MIFISLLVRSKFHSIIESNNHKLSHAYKVFNQETPSVKTSYEKISFYMDPCTNSVAYELLSSNNFRKSATFKVIRI